MNILIADDHLIIRTSLRHIIRESLKDVEIHEAPDGDSAWSLITKTNFDLVILDLHMPETAINYLVSNILTTYPSTRVMIFTMSEDLIFARHFLRMGVHGFLCKNCDDDEIIRAIEFLMNGMQYVGKHSRPAVVTVTGEEPADPFRKISPREFEVFILLLKGKSSKEMSNLLCLDVATISTHKKNLLQKLNVNNVYELSQLAKL